MTLRWDGPYGENSGMPTPFSASRGSRSVQSNCPSTVKTPGPLAAHVERRSGHDCGQPRYRISDPGPEHDGVVVVGVGKHHPLG